MRFETNLNPSVKEELFHVEAISIREAQSVAIDILDELVAFCDKHGIEYYLIGGALIGAVRSGDLLPWDDDIDVAMKRGDYERFCAEYVDGERYSLLTYKRAKNYRHGMAKLVDNATVFVEPTVLDDPYGIFIDIFPLDCIASEDDSLIGTLKWQKRIYNYAHVVSPFATQNNRLKNAVRVFLNVTIGRKPYKDDLENIEGKMEASVGAYLINHWGAWGARECGPDAWFDGTVDVKIREKKYKAPKGYHEWLTKIYGDYMKLPTNPPHYHGRAYRKTTELSGSHEMRDESEIGQ